MNKPNIVVEPVGQLPFGQGIIGEDVRFADESDRQTFADELGSHTTELTATDTAGCGDGRKIESLADGTSDPDVLRERVVSQMFGGPDLATAKAGLAANAGFVGGSRNFKEAHDHTVKLIVAAGINPGGHKKCGAAANIRASVENSPTADELQPVVQVILGEEVGIDEIKEILANQREQLDNGAYDGLSAEEHFNFLENNFPGNTAILEEDPNDHERHGHRERGVHLVREPGMGFANTAFVEDTGEQAFGITVPIFKRIADAVGGSPKERRRIFVALGIDTAQVANVLVAPGLQVFEQQMQSQDIPQPATAH